MAATATITVNPYPTGKEQTFQNQHIYGTITVNAGTYPALGIPLNWASKDIQTDVQAPAWCDIKTIGSGPGVYVYAYDSINNTMRILADSDLAAGSAPFVEFTASSEVPASVLNDIIAFHAMFRRS